MGLLDLLMPNSGLANYADQNRNFLGALGAGLGAGTDLNTGLAHAAQFAPQGAQLDYQQNLTQQSKNQTAQYLQLNGFPDLVPLALAGQGAEALDIAVKRQQPGYGQQVLAPGDVVVDQTTGKTIRSVPRPLEPISYGTQGFIDPNTGKQTPLDDSVTGAGDNGTGMVGGLTPAAIDQKALGYITSGMNPPIGRSGMAGVQSAAISNRMAELDPNGNLAANKSQLKSLTQSLGVQQKYLDNTQRSIANAEAGFQQLTNAFQGKVNLSQYPTINAAVNAVQGQTDPGTISAFKAGLQEVANEYTNVFSRGGQVSDATRQRAQDIVNGNLSINDLNKVLAELQAQGNIVIKGSQDQVKRINDQITSLGQGTPTTPTQASAAPVTKVVGGVTYTQDPDGGWSY